MTTACHTLHSPEVRYGSGGPPYSYSYTTNRASVGMAVVVALVTTQDARERISLALRRRADVCFATTVTELVAGIDRVRPGAVIVELTDRDAPRVTAALGRLRAEYPGIPVVAYCWVSAGAARHILGAARAGASALALRGHDDVGAMLESVLEEAGGGAVATEVLRALGAAVPGLVRLALDHGIRHARQELDVATLADALGLPRRTLVHRLQRTGYPSPAALISWCRLFVAAHLLETTTRSADDAALALGFASGSAMRGMLKRYTGLAPRALREPGGLLRVVRAFEEEVASGRAMQVH